MEELLPGCHCRDPEIAAKGSISVILVESILLRICAGKEGSGHPLIGYLILPPVTGKLVCCLFEGIIPSLKSSQITLQKSKAMSNIFGLRLQKLLDSSAIELIVNKVRSDKALKNMSIILALTVRHDCPFINLVDTRFLAKSDWNHLFGEFVQKRLNQILMERRAEFRSYS